MGAEMEFLPAGQLLGMNTSPIIAAFSSQTREKPSTRVYATVFSSRVALYCKSPMCCFY